MFKHEIASRLIDLFVERGGIDKRTVIKKMYSLSLFLRSNYSEVKKVSFHDTKFFLELVNKLDLPNFVCKVLYMVCKNKDFTSVYKVYNSLRSKWRFKQVKIVSASEELNSQSLCDDILKQDVASLDVVYDRSLIDGEVVIIDCIKFDNSIAGKLNKVENELLS